MSTRVMAECWPLTLPSSQKAVIISLADQANDEGVCWPSVGTIARRVCLSERAVQTALRALEVRGLVSRRPDSRGNGSTSSNWYTINLSACRSTLAGGGCGPGAPAASGTLNHVQGGVNVLHPPGERASPLEPSIEPKSNTPNPLEGGKHGSVQGGSAKQPAATTFEVWRQACIAKGEKCIPEDDPLYGYAERVGISVGLVHLHWAEFKRRMTDSGKRRRDWRQTLRESVQGNWYRLWWMPPGREAELTTAGRQAQAFHESGAR